MKSIASRVDNISFQKAAILVAALLLLVGSFLVYWSRRPVEPLIEREAVRDAVQTARPRMMKILSPEDLQSPITGARYEEIDRIVKEYVVGTYVDRIKLWNLKAQTVYSTLPSQIGEEFPGNEELLEALDGETVWEVTDEPESQDERSLGTTIEVYVPLSWQEGAAPQGVLEIYFDYSHHLALLAAIQRSTIGVLLAMSGAFVVGFLFLFRSGSRSIRRQRDLAAERARRVQVMKDITSVMTSPGTFEDRACRTLELLVDTSVAKGAVLRVVDEDAGGLRTVARVGQAPHDPAIVAVVGRGVGVAEAAWEQHKTIVANDYAANPEALPEIQAAGVKSLTALPIAHAGHLIGVVAVNSDQPGHFNPERIGLLETIANELGSLIENAQLRAQVDSELERSRRRLDDFQGAARGIMLREDPREALNNALGGACSLVDARWGGLFLKNEHNQVTTWVMGGMSPDVEQQLRIALEQTDATLMADQTNACVATAGILTTGGLMVDVESAFPAKGLLCISLSPRPGTFGGLFAGGKLLGRSFSADDERLFKLYAVAVQILLANVDLYADLAREHKRLANIQESMSEGLLVVNSDTMLEYVNPSAETILQLDAKDMIGNRLDDCLAEISVATEFEKAMAAARFAITRPELRPERVEVIVDRPTRKEVEFTPFHIPDDQSGPMAGLLLRNITIERDLQRRRDAFVTMASHQLRTPMVSVMGFTELMLKRDPPPDVRRQWLEQILLESQRLTAIADDILNVSRIQQGHLSVDLTGVSMPLQAAGVVANLKPAADKHIFVIQMDDGIPDVLADQRKVVDVLLNLLSNAMKYSPQGGTITVRAFHDQAQERVVTSVSDQGLGIAPENMKKLFSLFTRIDTSDTIGIRGTGLGLYIVRALLNLMNGEVWAESEAGKGSTFYFSLPVARPG